MQKSRKQSTTDKINVNPDLRTDDIKAYRKFIEVEEILDEAFNSDGRLFLKLQWADGSETSWEPYSFCNETLQSYYIQKYGRKPGPEEL